MSEAINKLIDDIGNKNFNDAEVTFNDLLNQKLKDSLDQAKIKVAGQIYNEIPDVEETDDPDAYEDEELLQAADEVEQEVDTADEIDLDDEEEIDLDDEEEMDLDPEE